MLYCGKGWQPSCIKRVIETLATSTRVAKVETDAGTGFLKGMGNPAGDMCLATELVAAELACWFSLITAPFAIVDVTDIEIPMVGYQAMQLGPAFISKEIRGTTGDGGKVLLNKINKIGDVSKLIVFDTWIRNFDRCPPCPHQVMPNRDNLFFTPTGRKFDLVAIDHSHCFVEGTLEDELASAHVVEDDQVYGNFPEFSDFIRADAVDSAIARLTQMDGPTAKQIVDSIPAQWGVTLGTRERWADVICDRAGIVAEHIKEKLLAQKCFKI